MQLSGRRPISILVFISLMLLITLVSACGDDPFIVVEREQATAAPEATTVPPVSPTATTAPTAAATAISNAPLAVVPSGTVELSVLVEPLDVGYVEVVGSIRLSNGDATELHKNDQINVIARPIDPELWRFDRWSGDLQGFFASDALVMDSSKKVRAIFVRVDERTQTPSAFYGVTLNGQPVHNLMVGVPNGSIEVSPPPGPGENPFREGTIVSLTPRPDEGYDLAGWEGDCGGSGPCVLTMNDHKEVTVGFKIKRYSLTVSAQPTSGGSATPSGTTDHNHGNTVSVNVQPASGYVFAGFEGDCSGTGSCSVLMDQPSSVIATFTKIPTPTPVPSPTAVPIATPMPLPPTPVPPTQTPIPSPTPVHTPTPTPVPPTPTPVPPTQTPIPSPTPVPTPTSTPVPASGKIAFSSRRDGNAEIYVMSADGSGQTRLTTNPAGDYSPAWSPDGGNVAFSSTRDQNYEIYVMNDDGSGQARLTSHGGYDDSPDWSPDSTRIAFNSRRDGDDEIYVMKANGAEQTRLTFNTASDDSPVWSPDGSKIAFRTDRDGNLEIYVMNTDGSGQIRLTDNSADDFSPAWSPDGREIAFHSRRDGNDEIYVMNVDGSAQTRLTTNSDADHSPAWSPDGSKIAFQSGRDGNLEIYVMNADGSGQTRLTSNATIDETPSWIQ